MNRLTLNTIKIFTLFFVFLILFTLPSSVKTQGVGCKDMKVGDECTAGDKTITYTGLDTFGNRKFTVKTVNLGADERYIDSPYLTDYLASIYKYAVIITIILATIVIIFAGVLWIISAGNAEQIGRAKKMIGRAITGLILAVGSYTILWTINPQLVEFGSLKILRVKDISLEAALSGIDDQDKDYGDQALPADLKPSQGGVLSAFGGIDPIKAATGLGYNLSAYFGQGQSPWGGDEYGPCGNTGTYKTSACAPTSIAMVFKHLGINVTPPDIGNIAVTTGARVCGKGTAMTKNFLDTLVSKYPPTKYKWVKEAEAKKLLSEGKWLIQSGKQAGFTGKNDKIRYRPNGHYLVFTGIRNVPSNSGTGTVIIYTINDSGRQSSQDGVTYQTEELFNRVKRDFLYFYQ